jgi:2-oxoglutarate ferredoxin oxidoreductase subunit alpha
MKLSLLIGGKAGQGINFVSKLISEVLADYGYFTFNYRDYQSLIRGGHNFNILTISDKQIGSSESKIDGIISLDNKTLDIHKKNLKKEGFIIKFEKFQDKNLGRNINIALAGSFFTIIGIDKNHVIKKIKDDFGDDAVKALKLGLDSGKQKMEIKKLKNKVKIKSGSQAIALGAVNSGIDLYIAYPMTPATPVMHELGGMQEKYRHLVFQAENEIAVANSALGASFAGAKTMIGSSGGGYDLMSEALSFQGQSEVPLMVYLSCRSGPGSGVPTYTSQADLDIALRAGHGEFPRIVAAPGDALESIEKTNELFYLSEKFKMLCILLGDKHIAESEYSYTGKPSKTLKFEIKRKVPGEGIVKASSYEHDKYGNTTESAELTKKGADKRTKKYKDMKKFLQDKKFEMIKIHGKKTSKNLVIGWGSTKGAILDSIEDLDIKFLQALYLKPLSNEIKKHMEKAKNIILVENNVTGQLGKLLREKTGISIPEKNRILKYDARPFKCDELKKEISKRLK